MRRSSRLTNPVADNGYPPSEGTSCPTATNQSIDFIVAVLLGMPLREVRSITHAYIYEAMRVIAEQGWLYIPGFGTFQLKAYRGNTPARSELQKKGPRGKRQLVAGIVKHEVRFTKSRRFRQMIHDHRGAPMEILRREEDKTAGR